MSLFLIVQHLHNREPAVVGIDRRAGPALFFLAVLQAEPPFGASYIFAPIEHWKTAKAYVNSECALADELHIPFREE